jgi:hypothetical protein
MRLQAASVTTSKCGDRCSLPSRRLPYAYDVYILAGCGSSTTPRRRPRT